MENLQACTLSSLLPETAPDESAFNTVVHGSPRGAARNGDISPFLVSSTPRVSTRTALPLKSSLKKPKKATSSYPDGWRTLWDTEDLNEEWIEQLPDDPQTPSNKVTFNGKVQEFSRTRSDILDPTGLPEQSMNNMFQSAASSIHIESLNESPVSLAQSTVRINSLAPQSQLDAKSFNRDLMSTLKLETLFQPPISSSALVVPSSEPQSGFKTPMAPSLNMLESLNAHKSLNEPVSPTLRKSLHQTDLSRHLPGHFPTPKACNAQHSSPDRESPSPPPSPKIVKSTTLESVRDALQRTNGDWAGSYTPSSTFGNQTIGGHNTTLRYLDRAMDSLEVGSNQATTPSQSLLVDKKSESLILPPPSSVGDTSCNTTAYTVKPVVESFKTALRDLLKVAKSDLELPISKQLPLTKQDSAKELDCANIYTPEGRVSSAVCQLSSVDVDAIKSGSFDLERSPKSSEYAITPESLALKLPVTPKDAQTLELLDISRQSLRSIANLEHSLPQLLELCVAHNELVFLSGASRSLLVLDASYNRLSQLTSFQALVNLQELNISHNQMKDLSGLACLFHLRELRADHNAVTSIEPLLSIRSLEVASLQHNAITKVELLDLKRGAGKMRLQELNLASNRISRVAIASTVVPSLESCYLHNNRISSFELHGESALKVLDLSCNHLSSFDGMFLSKLCSLDLSNNSVVRLTKADRLCELRHLKMSFEKKGKMAPVLESVPLGSLEHLETLDISGCRVAGGSLDLLEGSRHLESLIAAKCSITHLPKSVAKGIMSTCKLVDLHGNQLSDPESFCSLKYLARVESLDISENPISLHGPFLQAMAHLSHLKYLNASRCPVFQDYFQLSGIPQSSVLGSTQNKLQATLLLRKNVLRAYLILQLKDLILLNQQKVTARDKRWSLNVQTQVKAHVAQRVEYDSVNIISNYQDSTEQPLENFKLPFASPL